MRFRRADCGNQLPFDIFMNVQCIIRRKTKSPVIPVDREKVYAFVHLIRYCFSYGRWCVPSVFVTTVSHVCRWCLPEYFADNRRITSSRFNYAPSLTGGVVARSAKVCDNVSFALEAAIRPHRVYVTILHLRIAFVICPYCGPS